MYTACSLPPCVDLTVFLFQLCVSKLRLFIEDADQNLKYLGLLAMAKILKAQPKIVQQHKLVSLAITKSCIV